MRVRLFKLSLVVMTLVLCHGIRASVDDRPEGAILYYEESRQGKGNLMVLDLKTGDKRQVGQSGSRSDHFPSWSPDGNNIAFESYRRGGWHIWVSDADGRNARRLSTQGNYEFDPHFAPDNQTVIFKQGDDLWTVTLSDPTPRRVTPEDNGVSEAAPVYSPDGKMIVMMGHGNTTKAWNIYTLNRDGSGIKQITRGQGNNLSPQWSPDGQHILFYSDRNGSYELYEMTREGNDVRPIFNQAQLKTADFKKAALVDPWDNNWGATEQYRAGYSPNGQWIVFSRDVAGDRELFVARRDGSNVIRITDRTGFDGQPAWRPR